MAEITKTEKREDWQLHRRWHKRAAGQGESDKKDRCQRGRGERRQCPVQPHSGPWEAGTGGSTGEGLQEGTSSEDTLGARRQGGGRLGDTGMEGTGWPHAQGSSEESAVHRSSLEMGREAWG